MNYKEKTAEDAEKMIGLLNDAYDMAEGLRDRFSGLSPDLAGPLKEFCNQVRGKLYEIRELRGAFRRNINQIPD